MIFTILSTTSSIVNLLQSIYIASSAFLNGEISLCVSKIFLCLILSKTSPYVTFMPFSKFCLYLLLALSSTDASKNIFTFAFGNIVVPISLPSITIFPKFPHFSL